MNCTRLTPVLIALAGWLGTSPMAQAQSFTNGNTALPTTSNSGGCVGFADLDGDGYDDLVILDQSRVLPVPGAEWRSPISLGNVSGSSNGACAWGL